MTSKKPKNQPELDLQQTPKGPPNPANAKATIQTYFTHRKTGLFIALIAILIDYISKQIILAQLFPTPYARQFNTYPLIENLFHFTFSWNRGVSFSLLGNAQSPLNLFGIIIPADVWLPALLATIALAAAMLFTHLLGKEKDSLGKIGMGLIIGGAIGNLIDRWQYGAVVDFIHVFYGNWHFPIFNVADTALSFGVGLLILQGIVHYVQQKKGTPKT